MSQEDLTKIADKVWKNECKGTTEGLTHWNKGENFGSFGIAHFIWYAKGQEDRFEETFPSLLQFLQSEGAVLPTWLKNADGSPWKTREEFYKKIESPEMVSLRKFLFETRHLQAAFIKTRLEKAFNDIRSSVDKEQKEKVTLLFHRLAQDPQGLYALIDYYNCKGSGLSPKETYKNEGWGLLQVLLEISPSSKNLLGDFVEAAKRVLSRRVKNSPPENHEERWLKGWHSRMNTYLEQK